MRPGEEWGAACSDPPDVEVAGADHELALAVARQPGALIRFTPDAQSDIARAVGLRAGAELRNWAVPMDALQLHDGRMAVNMVILGTPPPRIRSHTRWFAVDGERDSVLAAVIASGQFRHGHDLVPRSHPGDGWAEFQLYRVPIRQRAGFRKRLATGTHVPHPAITQRRVTTIAVSTAKPVPLEIDCVQSDPVRTLSIQLIPNAYRLLL